VQRSGCCHRKWQAPWSRSAGSIDLRDYKHFRLFSDRDIADRDIADRDIADRDIADRGKWISGSASPPAAK
jgi:hypothetical protein